MAKSPLPGPHRATGRVSWLLAMSSGLTNRFGIHTQGSDLIQILSWNSIDLESKLLEFRDYYNGERVHSGIGGSTPCEAGGALTAGIVKLDNFRWQARCRGFYQLPVAA